MRPLIENPSPHTAYMRDWRRLHREECDAYQRAYWAQYNAIPENAARNRARAAEWHAANRQRANAKSRAYYRANLEAARTRVKLWGLANPERLKETARERQRRYRARKKEAA